MPVHRITDEQLALCPINPACSGWRGCYFRSERAFLLGVYEQSVSDIPTLRAVWYDIMDQNHQDRILVEKRLENARLKACGDDENDNEDSGSQEEEEEDDGYRADDEGEGSDTHDEEEITTYVYGDDEGKSDGSNEEADSYTSSENEDVDLDNVVWDDVRPAAENYSTSNQVHTLSEPATSLGRDMSASAAGSPVEESTLEPVAEPISRAAYERNEDHDEHHNASGH